MLEQLRVGTIFKWHDFPHQDDGKIKDRFFIYFGKTAFGLVPVILHLFTTTTRDDHYNSGGNRKNHSITRFSKGELGFTEDCILDVDMGVDSYPEKTFEHEKITKTGELPVEKIEEIYSLIHSSRYIPRVVKNDIYFTVRNVIPGIRRP